MKKEVEKVIPAQPAKRVTETIVTCDFCPSKASYQCILCRRDICHKATDSHTEWDEREYGDYPDKYCPICHELKFKKYDAEYYEIVRIHDNALEALDAKIKAESLAINSSDQPS